MPYKDKDRQKESNRQASQRRRAKLKGMTPKDNSHTQNVIPDGQFQQMPDGSLVGDGYVPTKDVTINRCKYCGLPADQPSPQCNRH